MNSDNTSDEDVDTTVTENANEQSLFLLSLENSKEEEDNQNCKNNTVITDEANETETLELETHDSSIPCDVSQISDCEPTLNSNENLSNNSNPTSEDLNYEILTSRRDDDGMEDFLMSMENHHVPELHWSWENNFLNVPQIIINADANNHRNRNSANEVELNAFINSRSLYTINEEGSDERTTEPFTHRLYLSPQNRTRSSVRPTEVNETPLEPRSSVSDYDNQYLNRELVRNQAENMIYIPELNIYRNSMLNALANENILMEELYEANRRLNVIHDQQMFDAINNQAANAVEDVVEEMNPIDNIEVLPVPMQEEVPVQPQPEVPVQPQLRLFPFQQLILIANGGISPLNGQHNALMHLIFTNPSLMFLNIRNIILIVHPRILVGGEDNEVFDQNLHWVSVRELLRTNTVILNYENRDSNNGNQEFNGEAGPSNERNR